MHKVKTNLAILEGDVVAATAAAASIKPSDDITKHSRSIPNVLTLLDLVRKLDQIKGAVCDGCKKRTNNANGGKASKLQQCARCRRFWYCSQECQRADWKAGHRKSCREPFDLKGGDIVQLRGLSDKELNGTIVVVVKAVNGDDDEENRDGETGWMVKTIGAEGERTLSVKACRTIMMIPVEERSEEIVDWLDRKGGF
ncbi:hypothetical protein HDU76_008307 [Blyttiomyces sp. JEL0837]|nr:hypothetical protein HDU76_008307 [Blyttiomyces sp. JEL0837]